MADGSVRFIGCEADGPEQTGPNAEPTPLERLASIDAGELIGF